jgi:hypothetical protein
VIEQLHGGRLVAPRGQGGISRHLDRNHREDRRHQEHCRIHEPESGQRTGSQAVHPAEEAEEEHGGDSLADHKGQLGGNPDTSQSDVVDQVGRRGRRVVGDIEALVSGQEGRGAGEARRDIS